MDWRAAQGRVEPAPPFKIPDNINQDWSTMKVIIAGSRDITDKSLIFEAIRSSGFEITEVVSGGCRGVDTVGEEWAKLNKIPVRRFSPKYGVYPGRVAPLIRNTEMAKYGDALIAVRKVGVSNGTDDMIEKAKEHKLKIFIMIVGDT